MEKVIEIDFSLARKNRDSDELTFERKTGDGCMHLHGYWIDDRAEFVECKLCGERLNPLWVIRQMANAESRYRNQIIRYQGMTEELKNRNRTKCQHCGQMTRIIK